MKVLLTGKDGQLGFELQRALAPLAEVYAINRQDCDLACEARLRQLVRRVNPDLIVNSAAYTAVDRAETEPKLVRAVNSYAPAVLGEEAQRIGAWVIHYSTDYVFDGLAGSPYEEGAPTHPLNIYGLSKRDGELALQAACPQHLIFRTSWVFGVQGSNFTKTILRLATERDALNIVDDQCGTPTSAALLADVTAQVVGRVRREGLQDFPFGLYHLTAAGETTWYHYARFVVEETLRAGKPLKINTEAIRPIASTDYPVLAKRPANSRLDTSLFRNTFDLTLPAWQSGVLHVLQQIL